MKLLWRRLLTFSQMKWRTQDRMRRVMPKRLRLLRKLRKRRGRRLRAWLFDRALLASEQQQQHKPQLSQISPSLAAIIGTSGHNTRTSTLWKHRNDLKLHTDRIARLWDFSRLSWTCFRMFRISLVLLCSTWMGYASFLCLNEIEW